MSPSEHFCSLQQICLDNWWVWHNWIAQNHTTNTQTYTSLKQLLCVKLSYLLFQTHPPPTPPHPHPHQPPIFYHLGISIHDWKKQRSNSNKIQWQKNNKKNMLWVWQLKFFFKKVHNISLYFLSPFSVTVKTVNFFRSYHHVEYEWSCLNIHSK